MKLKPLSNHILVEAAADEAMTTKSGIVLPDTADKKKQVKGKVTAVGPGKLSEKGDRLPLSVKVGDNVLFKEPWSDDHKFEEDGKKLFLVEEDDILGILE
ncbi:MAG: co-chaperone GroES [Candidatus Jorgensenbacteria bacterium]|nr:co-chaperone GroES [Candidatus Jorgensenbacteria bacterium]